MSVDRTRAIAQAYSPLICAELTVLAARLITTPVGHLAVVTAKERTGGMLEFWAGAALRADPETALADATGDALLRPWGGSVLVAGAARLVADGTCTAARISDDRGVAIVGRAIEFPPINANGARPEPGARLAVRTRAGDFLALCLQDASVMLHLAPGWNHAHRVDSWFDMLDITAR